MASKLDQIYLDNLAVDAGEVLDIEKLQTKARQEMQPSLFDLEVLSEVGYGTPPIEQLMTEDDKKFSRQLTSAVAKGQVMEGAGLVGDLLGILKGVYNITDRDWQTLSQRIQQPDVQPQVETLLESFMRGFEDIKELNLPPILGMTSEAVDEKLTEMGWSPETQANTEEKKSILEGGKVFGQVTSGGPLIVENVLKKLGTGYKSAKKFINEKKYGTVDTGIIKNNPEFKSWFGKSKVMDVKGNPIILYHGSTVAFDKFKTPNQLDPKNSSGVVWLTSYKGRADLHAGSSFSEGGNITPVYVKMENPYYGWAGTDVEQIDKLKAQGYDGMILEERGINVGGENDTVYLIFDDDQVKPALSVPGVARKVRVSND